ncbi:UbiA family prenyltransferase [Streptomyces sparsogenes]|uniref:UbiA family prenyltransferase n=1 Tax=Streptomyces sparsogenes TaxID=67365 RepID=UPI003321BDA3
MAAPRSTRRTRPRTHLRSRTPLSTRLLAHLQTWRPYTLWYPGLVGLAGAALAGGDPPARWLAVAWAAPTLGWVAGHYLGDWFDRRLDAISKPQRPIPSGRLSPRAAVAAGLVCATAMTGLALWANWRSVAVAAAAAAGIVAYSRVLKGRGLSGNVMRGALTALALLFGAMAVQAWPPWHALPFALAFWAHDTASNLVGTVRDVDGDREGGYATLPVRRGVRRAAHTAAALYLAALATAAVALAATPSSASPPDGPAGAAVLLAAAAGCGGCAFAPLLRSPGRITAPRALRAHQVLVAERLVLAAAVLATGAGTAPALAVLVPCLAVSVVTQARMRAAYEFPTPPHHPAPVPDPGP